MSLAKSVSSPGPPGQLRLASIATCFLDIDTVDDVEISTNSVYKMEDVNVLVQGLQTASMT